MKKFNIIVMAFVAMVMVSCGGGNSSIKPVSEKISGPLGQYFEVVSKDYQLSDGEVRIELKRIQDGFPEPWNPSMKVGYSDGYFEPLFTAEFQDENGNVLSKDKLDIVWDRDDLEELAALQVDETCTIKFDVDDKDSQLVKLSSTFEVHEATGSSYSSYSSDDDEYESDFDDSSSDFSVDFSDAGSADWDQLLDEYEQFVNSYISIINKASNGNASAITECMEMMEKAERMSNQMDNAKGDMSTAQMDRLIKIQNKIAGQASKLSGVMNNMDNLLDDVEDMIDDIEDLDDIDDAVNSLLNGWGD